MKVYILITQYLHHDPVCEAAFLALDAANLAAAEAVDEYTTATVEALDIRAPFEYKVTYTTSNPKFAEWETATVRAGSEGDAIRKLSGAEKIAVSEIVQIV